MEELDTHIDACPCGHVYHHKCIMQWVNQKRLCPQCKADALPLMPLTFNLFQLSKEEKALSHMERVGLLKSESRSVSMSIENEIAEINVLEPQLAEFQAERKVYEEGIGPRERHKCELEASLLEKRTLLAKVQARMKALNEEFAGMRDNLCRFEADDRRRPVHISEVPKIVSFWLADSKKFRDINAQKTLLQTELTKLKDTLVNLRKHLVEPMVRLTTKNLSYQGFVPIDYSSKRVRQEKEIENINPIDSLNKLSALVSLFSDEEEEDVIELE